MPVVHRAAVREKRLVCPPPTATFREPGSDLRAPPDNPSNQQNRAASGGRVGATAAVYSAAILGASISRPRLPGPRRFRKIWNSFITRPEKPEPDANLRPPLHPSDSDRVPHRRGSRARRQRLQGSQGASSRPSPAPTRVRAPLARGFAEVSVWKCVPRFKRVDSCAFEFSPNPTAATTPPARSPLAPLPSPNVTGEAHHPPPPSARHPW